MFLLSYAIFSQKISVENNKTGNLIQCKEHAPLTWQQTFPLQDILKNPVINVTLLFSFLFSRRGKNILWKKRNNWKIFKPPGLLSFHFCFSEGYNERSRETSAVMSVQTNGFRSIAQSRLCVAFGGLVLPQRAPTGVFWSYHSTHFPHKCS